MLSIVPVKTRAFDRYAAVLPPQLYQQVQQAAHRLQGRRVLQINTTSLGGGVAEILRSSVPLLNDLGLDAQWGVMKAPPEFYEVTKKIHNGMQGGPENLTTPEWRLYEETNEALAAHIDPHDWDLIYVHDPQPAAVRSFLARSGPAWLWRSHIDTTSPNPQYSDRIRVFAAGYDASVYSLQDYVLPGSPSPSIIAPAIDPLNQKNAPQTLVAARRRVARFGIDLSRPLVTQVSRFDPWKDPLGVIEAWKQAREHVPGLQLALVGQAADDDPEGVRVLRRVRAKARGLRDLHIIANRADDAAVHAFQTVSDVVLQKSLREGFGLTVSEALWSGTPVIGGRVGGIPQQVRDGRTGYLVTSVEECARRLALLAKDGRRARRMGTAGRADVQRRFLLPRLMLEELRLWDSVLRRRRSGPMRGRMRAGPVGGFEVRPKSVVKWVAARNNRRSSGTGRSVRAYPSRTRA